MASSPPVPNTGPDEAGLFYRAAHGVAPNHPLDQARVMTNRYQEVPTS
jgi:hypothetical protein